MFLHLGDGIGKQFIGHFRIEFLDCRIGRGVVAIEIIVPADDGGIDEALHQIGLLVDDLVPRLDQGRIGVKAVVGDQDHARLDPGRLLDRIGLRGDVALHRALLVGEERLRVEGIGPHLLLVEAVLRLQPLIIAGDAFLGDEQRQRLEIFKLGDLQFRVRQKNLRILLEDRRHRRHRHIVGDGIKGLQRVRGHEEIELARDQERAVVGVGAARHDGDVEPVFLVGAVGDRLEEAAMLGFRDPVGSERDLVQGLSAHRRNGSKERQQGCG